MRARGVNPRGLADDLTITATGKSHELSFRSSYAATFNYLVDLEARPAPKKCFTFSTSADSRFRLKMHHWHSLGTAIKVVNDTRDFGRPPLHPSYPHQQHAHCQDEKGASSCHQAELYALDL